MQHSVSLLLHQVHLPASASARRAACISCAARAAWRSLCGSSRVALHFLYLVAFMRASTGSDIKTVSSRVVVAVVVVADIR